MWLLVPVGLVALYALHELVAFAVARAVAGEPRRRVFVVVAHRSAAAIAFGAAMVASYLALSTLAFAFYACHGVDSVDRQLVVSEVKDGFDASGKLIGGDVVLACDGTPLAGRGLVRLVEAGDGKPVTLTIERDGLARDVVVQPTRVAEHWVLGIVPRYVPIAVHDTATALQLALWLPVDQVKELAREIRGQVSPPSIEPSGPKRIVDEFAFEPPITTTVWRQLMRLGVILLLALLIVDAVRVWRLDGARAPR